MFEDTLDLAENKLILLFIFKKVNIPISNIKITQIVLENNYMNYFTLQQYINELISSNLLDYTNQGGKQRILITEKGIRVLKLFENRIKKEKINNITEYLDKKITIIKKDMTVTADYTIDNKNTFVVNLKALENDITLIDLKFTVGSNKQAKEICSNWKEHTSELYDKIIKILIK